MKKYIMLELSLQVVTITQHDNNFHTEKKPIYEETKSL